MPSPHENPPSLASVPSPAALALDDWENAWAPYDDATYASALAALTHGDTVLDIGAGDLRFARRAAARVQRVIAIEQRAGLCRGALPPNLTVIYTDARTLDFPVGITVAVLLMRHCRHFALYREKLLQSGCRRLITNARWGMDVECIDLSEPLVSFLNLEGGWYACSCGAVGFKLADRDSRAVAEVRDCPRCAGNRDFPVQSGEIPPVPERS